MQFKNIFILDNMNLDDRGCCPEKISLWVQSTHVMYHSLYLSLVLRTFFLEVYIKCLYLISI